MVAFPTLPVIVELFQNQMAAAGKLLQCIGSGSAHIAFIEPCGRFFQIFPRRRGINKSSILAGYDLPKIYRII